MKLHKTIGWLLTNRTGGVSAGNGTAHHLRARRDTDKGG